MTTFNQGGGVRAQAQHPAEKLVKKSEELAALAERVEAATGPDRALDTAIANLLVCHFGWHAADALASFTASLDAAMALVPLRCWDHMEVYQPDHQTLGWTVHLLPNGNFTAGNSHEGFGQSFALALTAAALRALAQNGGAQ